MKIIFDNDAQIKAFMSHVASDYCPSIFGVYECRDECVSEASECESCWERYIKMEVKVDDNRE